MRLTSCAKQAPIWLRRVAGTWRTNWRRNSGAQFPGTTNLHSACSLTRTLHADTCIPPLCFCGGSSHDAVFLDPCSFLQPRGSLSAYRRQLDIRQLSGPHSSNSCRRLHTTHSAQLSTRRLGPLASDHIRLLDSEPLSVLLVTTRIAVAWYVRA